MAVGIVRAQMRPVVPRQPVLAGPGRLRKIALLGSHELSLKDAPWDDPSWEFWGHASSRGLYKREPDRYFDRHRRECWTKSNNKGQIYLKWLARNRVPIYMLERYADVPASIRYPFEQVSFGMARKYFTNHAAYMIALALMEGCTHLGFFGVNYGKDTPKGADVEYGNQRGSCEYWMGRAEAIGVQLILPDGCSLLADPKEIYGPESHDAEGVLVQAYRRRTWIQPEGGIAAQQAAIPKLPDGRMVPPQDVLEAMKEEDADMPRPEFAKMTMQLGADETATEFPAVLIPDAPADTIATIVGGKPNGAIT